MIPAELFHGVVEFIIVDQVPSESLCIEVFTPNRVCRRHILAGKAVGTQRRICARFQSCPVALQIARTVQSPTRFILGLGLYGLYRLILYPHGVVSPQLLPLQLLCGST